MDAYASIPAPIAPPVEAAAEVLPAAPTRSSLRSRVAGIDISRAARWGRRAGPGTALLVAGIVIGAIVGNSWSASAVDGGTSTPVPSTSVQQDLPREGTDMQGGLSQGFGGQRALGRGGGPIGGQMGGQMGRLPDGMTGGFGGFGQQVPSDGTTQAPGATSPETGSPTRLLTF